MKFPIASVFLSAFFVLIAIAVKDDNLKPLIENDSSFNTSNVVDISHEKSNVKTILYVCGDEPTNVCHCEEDGAIYCEHSWQHNYTNVILKNVESNLAVKKVKFEHQNFTTFSKNQILPDQETSIKTLILYWTNISHIEDGAFDSFTSLKKLDLNGNYLRMINETVFTEKLGSTLEELDLTSTFLKNVRVTGFSNLKKLASLNLSQNYGLQLSTLANGKNVTIFPKGLRNLKTLNLENCDFDYLEDDVFINLRSLETLILRQTHITTVPKSIKHLLYLIHLNLQETRISRIDNCCFCGLIHLRKVNLDQTFRLSYIHENAFGAVSNSTLLPKLENLYLQDNQLSILPEKLLNWKYLKQLNTERNPWRCNCSMAWLINDINSLTPFIADKLINNENQSYKNKMRCHYPIALTGMYFHTVSGDFCKNNAASYNNAAEEEEEDVDVICSDVVQTYSLCKCDDENGLSCGPGIKHTNYKMFNKNAIIKSIWLNGANLNALTKDSFLHGFDKDIEQLSLHYIKNKIESGIFDKFTSLKTLNLERNKLKQINDGIFSQKLGLTLLKLNLEFNELQNLSSKTFEYLTKLNVLKLNYNKNILQTSKEIFSVGLRNLKELHLSHCNISSLEEDAFDNLISLEKLDISANPLSQIPITITNLQNLVHLNFQLNMLSHFGNCTFCSMKKLKILELDFNYDLSFLHENAFGALSNGNPTQLDKFSISECNVSILPEKLLDWKNVKSVDIEHNPLTCNCSMAWLINDFKASKALYIDNLRHHYHDGNNKDDIKCYAPQDLAGIYLQNIANGFCMDKHGNTTVEKDDKFNYSCYYNNNSAIEAQIKGIPRVLTNKQLHCFFDNETAKKNFTFFQKETHVISLNDSLIQSIENGILDTFKKVYEINLSNNLLTTIDENILTKEVGSMLKYMDLSGNRIKTLKATAFIHLTKLEQLSLNNNHGINLTNIFPASLSNLRVLVLLNCSITELDENVFVNLTSLDGLGLSRNPITTIPIAINALTNLKYLFISHTNITVLTNNGLNMNKNLKDFIADFSNIERIEDCAFCSFPNIQKIHLQHSRRLSFIHENAFGAISNNGTTPILEDFKVPWCNLSSLPEKALNWSSILRFDFRHNPFYCDCHIDWLINITRSDASTAGYQCHGPAEFKGAQFYNIPTLLCNDICGIENNTARMIQDIIKTMTSKTTVNVNWSFVVLFLIILFIIVAILISIIVYYRNQKATPSIRRLYDEHSLAEYSTTVHF